MTTDNESAASIDRPPALNAAVHGRLKRKIAVLDPGTPLESERLLAKNLGVSRPTLRNALNRLREEGMISTRHGSGNFVTDAVVRKTLVTLFYRDSIGDTYGPCYEEIVKVMTPLGHSMNLLCNPDSILSAGPALSELNAFGSVDVLLLLGVMDSAYVRQAMTLGCPVVTVDYAVPGTHTDAVTFDSFGAGSQMMEHMVSHGHKKVAYIGGYRGNPYKRQPEADSLRLKAGMEYTAQLHGVAIDADWSLSLPVGDCDEAVKAISSLLKQYTRPTGIVFFDPAHAEAAIRYFQEQEIAVPGDVSIICRGQDERLGRGIIPITTIPVNMKEMGRTVGQVLQMRSVDALSSPMHVAIPSALLNRDTVTRPR